MIGLTPRQRDLLTFLREWPHPWAPSFSEMAAGLGLASNDGVSKLLDGLIERAYVRKLPNRARAIELLPERVTINGQPFMFIPKQRAA